MLMTKKKANRLIKEAYKEGYVDGHFFGSIEERDQGYEERHTKDKRKSIDVCIGEDKVREVIDKINNENKRYRYF